LWKVSPKLKAKLRENCASFTKTATLNTDAGTFHRQIYNNYITLRLYSSCLTNYFQFNILATRLANVRGPICSCRIPASRIVVVQFAAVAYPPREM